MDALLRPDVGLIVWSAATFLIVVWLVGRFCWPSLVAALDERERKARQAVEAAEQAQAEAENTRRECAALIGRAREEAAAVLERARQGAQEAREETLAAAQKDAFRALERARREIALASSQAREDLRRETVDLAFAVARRVLQRELVAADQERFLDLFAGPPGGGGEGGRMN